MTTIALIDESRGVSGGDLYGMASALERNAAHCAQAWGVAAPTVELWSGRRVLPRGYWPIYFVDETSDDENTLAVHYQTFGRPTGRVYVGNASGLNQGSNSVSEAAAHELLEMLINAFLDGWDPMPGRPGWFVAREVCDPVQTHYLIEIDGTEWKVANFVTPAWFQPVGSGPYDYRDELKGPGQIGPRGYAILRSPAGVGEYVFGSAKLQHPLKLRSLRVLRSEGSLSSS